MTMAEEQYQQDRNAAYDRILSLVQRHIDAIPVEMTLDLSLISPSKARDAAERDVWKLFQSGIRHLKNGGQMDAPGSFAGAVTRASLRNAPMASTLGVKPPQFDENYVDIEFDSGAAEAVFRSRRLMEAVTADAPKSQQLIRQKLGFTAPLAMPDAGEGISDPELKGVFDAARKSAAAKEAGEDNILAAIRRQAVLSFNLICEVYAPAAATLKGEIAELFSQPPPKPGLKNQSFDL
ncbi:MAG: hypothetical protein EPN97_12500 [Alphaproteobacteria bacterium]|nr:MAG: hypothetical protein EPN97_12500 [Alphaproteobacteria bacterium]